MWRRWKATIISSWAHCRPNHHWPLLLTWLSALSPSPRETKLKVQAAFKHDYELGQHVVVVSSSSICPIGQVMFNYAKPSISQMRLAPKRRRWCRVESWERPASQMQWKWDISQNLSLLTGRKRLTTDRTSRHGDPLYSLYLYKEMARHWEDC